MSEEAQISEEVSITSSPELSYATFGVRAAAAMVDSLVEMILQGVIGFLLGSLSYGFLSMLSPSADVTFGATIGTAYTVVWCTFSFFHKTVWQWYFGATIGKQIFGLRLVELSGDDVKFFTTVKRVLFTPFSAIPFCLGYLAPLWTEKNQTFHDSLARTVVVYKRSS